MSDIDIVKTQVDTLLAQIGVNPSVDFYEEADDTYRVEIDGSDLNFLIGYRGDVLEGLQTILGLHLLKALGRWVHVIVDINGYKQSKLERIENIAKSFIDKVRFMNKEMELPPMNPFERHHVHVFVAGYPDIESESHGEGLARRVVLRPAKGIKK